MKNQLWFMVLMLSLVLLSCSSYDDAPSPVASMENGGPVFVLDSSCADNRIVATVDVGQFDNLIVWDVPNEPREFYGSETTDYVLRVRTCSEDELKAMVFAQTPAVIDLSTGEVELQPEIGRFGNPHRTGSGQNYSVKDGALFRWVGDNQAEQVTVTSFITESLQADLVVSDTYAVVGKRTASGEGVLLEAWPLTDSIVSEPSATHLYEGGWIMKTTITEDNRFIGVGDDKLFIWDIDSGETTTIDSVDASYYVFVLENGLIVTSGRKGRLEPIDPDKPQLTRFWDPETLEEVRSIEGLRITRAAPMSEGRVAFAVELDDTEATRGDQGSHYRIEVWDLDEIAEG